MSQAPFMPLAADALVGDTLHLSTEEFGAYVLILLATWRNNGKPLKNDDRILSRVCRVSERKWKANLKLMLLPFFDISDGYLHQKRLEKEWKRVANLREIRRSVGKLGGRPKTLKNKDTGKAIANLLGKQNESKTKAPIPIPLKDSDSDKSESAELPLADPVKAFWNEGLETMTQAGVEQKQARGMIGKWRREFGEAAVSAALAIARQERPSDIIPYVSRCLGKSRAAKEAAVGGFGAPGLG